MDNEAAKRWRPTIRSILTNSNTDEAVESILRLLEPPQPAEPEEEPSGEPPEAPTQPRPARSRRRRTTTPTQSGSSSELRMRAKDGDLIHKEPLPPFEYYSVEQASEFVGVNVLAIYRILKSSPALLPHKREKGESNQERSMILGRALNRLRFLREQNAQRQRGIAAGDDDGAPRNTTRTEEQELARLLRSTT
jgi:hypothetical protein